MILLLLGNSWVLSSAPELVRICPSSQRKCIQHLYPLLRRAERSADRSLDPDSFEGLPMTQMTSFRVFEKTMIFAVILLYFCLKPLLLPVFIESSSLCRPPHCPHLPFHGYPQVAGSPSQDAQGSQTLSHNLKD